MSGRFLHSTLALRPNSPKWNIPHMDSSPGSQFQCHSDSDASRLPTSLSIKIACTMTILRTVWKCCSHIGYGFERAHFMPPVLGLPTFVCFIYIVIQQCCAALVLPNPRFSVANTTVAEPICAPNVWFHVEQAMSCPPQQFLAPRFLQAARAALAPGGVLAVNCVTRSNTAFRAAVTALQAEFPEVCFLMVALSCRLPLMTVFVFVAASDFKILVCDALCCSNASIGIYRGNVPRKELKALKMHPGVISVLCPIVRPMLT